MLGDMHAPDGSYHSYQKKWFDTGTSVRVRPRFFNELQTGDYEPFGTRLTGASRLPTIVATFDSEGRVSLNLYRMSQLAHKPIFHSPRKCLIRRAPNSQSCLPTNK
jgi:hypothetical protein